jgi:hypothetical protein
MTWDVEYTDEFADWWKCLPEKQQAALDASIGLLAEVGPFLGFPHCSGVSGSRHNHMRELRTQQGGKPLRTLYAFDPRRAVILLIGGDKTGNNRWYSVNIAKADRLYDEHLQTLEKEGQKNGQ